MNAILAGPGRSVVFAIGAWVLALVFYFSTVQSLVHENERLSFLEADRAAPAANPPANQPQFSLDNLPGEARRTRDLARMLAFADQSGLRITQRNFAEQTKADSGLIRLTGRLTAEAPYTAHRAWLDEILSAMPSLSIQTLRFDQPGEPTSSVQMSLDFIYLSTSRVRQAEPAEDMTTRRIPTDFAATVSDPFNRPPAQPPNRRVTREAPATVVTLPFAFSGRYESTGSDIYLLTASDNIHRVRPGETIGQTEFRLDSVDREALHFTHLPTSARLSLPIGQRTP